MSERALLAWCTGGGGGATTWESAIEWKELARETGGGNSSGTLGCVGGKVGFPTGSTSAFDVEPTTLSEKERGASGRYGGAGGGSLWIAGVYGASNGGVTWEGASSGERSNLASDRGGGRGGSDGCEGWTGGGALWLLERTCVLGDGGPAAGCLGGGGARVLFLSSDMAGVKREVDPAYWAS